VSVGEALEFELEIEALDDTMLMVDYVIHFCTKKGTLSPKVHKLKKLALSKGKRTVLKKRHPFKANMTTRTLYAGEHLLQVQINGAIVYGESFSFKVDVDNTKKIDSISFKKWVNDYDIAPIDPKSLPTNETIHVAKSADIVLTSTLRRTIDSADILGVEVLEQNSLFNEAGIPEVNIPFIKLKPKSWLMILRLMLLLGLGKKDTSLKASKAQASNAAKRLLELSLEYEHIALVGHGGMNWLLGKELKKAGWKLEGKTSHDNWGMTVFRKE